MPYLGKQADENGAVINSYEFLQGTDTSTGTTAFSVPSNAGDHIEVYLNGILIVEGGSNDYTRTTSTITFASSPSDGDLIKINVIGSITIFDTVPASGGTFSGNVVFGGTVTMQSANNQGFASGTKMLFQQTAAPTGWTKVTSSNDVALRVVSGTVGSGGSVAFETAFASQTIPTHTLTAAQLPDHYHDIRYAGGGSNDWGLSLNSSSSSITGTFSSGNMGGEAHGHGSVNLDVSYVDVIIATKD